jgi:hypothetical protein
LPAIFLVVTRYLIFLTFLSRPLLPFRFTLFFERLAGPHPAGPFSPAHHPSCDTFEAICSGFQVLAKCGLLGNNGSSNAQGVTIANNDSGKFGDRWVYLSPQSDRCVFIEQWRRIYLPIVHGEGKVVTKSESDLKELREDGFVAFNYVDKDGNEGGYPVES